MRNRFERARWGFAAAWLGAALLAVSCTGGSSSAPSVSPSAEDSAAASPSATEQAGPRSPVAGIVVSIQSEGLDKVRGFVLRTKSGTELTFVLGTLDDPTDFPPGHLAEHQASASPVLVSFKNEDGKLVVYHLEDAP